MDENTIIDAVLMLPVIRSIEMPESDKRSSVRAQLPFVLKKILYAHDWDFAWDETTTDSVVSQADYILKGKNGNARDIINIRYGDNDVLLNKRKPTDLDEWMSGRTQSTVAIWTPIGFEFGSPKVKLTSAPTATGETITYRYRKMFIALAEFPDDFSVVVQSGLAQALVPDYYKVYKGDLENMIDMYSYGGGEDAPAKLDPLVVHHNNRRARLFGYGG